MSTASRPIEFRVDVAAARTTALVYDAAGAEARPEAEASAAPTKVARAALVLAHGAGAGQQSAFIVNFARAVAGLGIDVVTFNFLYTEQKRRLPDRGPQLEACYRAVIEAIFAHVASAKSALFIGGKSMGGRIATQVAASDMTLPIAGLVLLGYPLHPPGKPDKLRDAHLPSVRRPMLFVQGSRDTFGTPGELTPILETLSPKPTLFVVEGGDHSFKRSRGGEAAQAAIDDDVRRTSVEWMDATLAARADAGR